MTYTDGGEFVMKCSKCGIELCEEDINWWCGDAFCDSCVESAVAKE